jgi:hypothetical protein
MPNMKQLKQMAKELGVRDQGKLSKPNLIRAIQMAEGNDPCYERISQCGQDNCLFFSECQPAPMTV